MTDVATLGLAVDSSQVDKGKIALDQLSNSAKRAQAAAGGVSASTKNAGAAAVSLSASAGRAAASLNAEAAAAQKATQAMRAHAAAANSNLQATKNFHTANLAAQFQDIAVSAQMGMGALQIGLQQGTQVAAVLATMERPVQGLAQAFASVISPVSLLTIGLISLAAAGLQFIDWTKVGAALLRGLADVLETVAPYAVGAAAGLALLYAPAILSGIAAVAVGVWGLVRALGAAAVAMAIANPAAAFVLGITAIVAAAVVLRDEITEIFGRDIIGDVKTAANFVINSFVAAFEDIKFVWANFPDIIGAAVIGAANAVIKATDSMINRAIGAMNNLINSAKMALRDMGTPVDIPFINPVDLGQMDNPYAGKVGKANAKHRANVEAILSRDTLGEFGGAITRGASAASDKLRELAGSLGDVEGKTKKTKSETERLAERYNDILLGAEGFIASQMAEKDALLLTEEAANALRYEQDLLNEAMQAGIKIDAAKAAELKSYAAAMASAEAETSRLRDALDFAQGVSRGFFEDFAGGLRRGEGLWKSFADAAVNALDKVASKLLDSGLDMLFGGGSTGGYGIIGSLLGFGGGGGIDPWAGLRGYADGTASARAGVAMVGERGPELVRFRGGEQVVPNHMLGRGANNNQPVAANFNFAPVVSIQGGGGDTSEEVTKALKQFADKDFTPRVVKALREIKTRGLA